MWVSALSSAPMLYHIVLHIWWICTAASSYDAADLFACVFWRGVLDVLVVRYWSCVASSTALRQCLMIVLYCCD
eukprot:5618464-Pyramimonas_sp.AAC.2